MNRGREVFKYRGGVHRWSLGPGRTVPGEWSWDLRGSHQRPALLPRLSACGDYEQLSGEVRKRQLLAAKVKLAVRQASWEVRIDLAFLQSSSFHCVFQVPGTEANCGTNQNGDFILFYCYTH